MPAGKALTVWAIRCRKILYLRPSRQKVWKTSLTCSPWLAETFWSAAAPLTPVNTLLASSKKICMGGNFAPARLSRRRTTLSKYRTLESSASNAALGYSSISAPPSTITSPQGSSSGPNNPRSSTGRLSRTERHTARPSGLRQTAPPAATRLPGWRGWPGRPWAAWRRSSSSVPPTCAHRRAGCARPPIFCSSPGCKSESAWPT